MATRRVSQGQAKRPRAQKRTRTSSAASSSRPPRRATRAPASARQRKRY